MAENWIAGALVGRTFDIGGGLRVRLRLAHLSDVRAIVRLLGRHGIETAGLDAHRLVQFDPRDRYVICATGLIDGTEQLLGVGAIDLNPGAASEPDVLVVAPELQDALPDLLIRVLRGVAGAGAPADAA